MKIRTLTAVVYEANGDILAPGVYDLPDSVARGLTAAGVAEAVEEPKAEKKVDKVEIVIGANTNPDFQGDLAVLKQMIERSGIEASEVAAP